MSKYLSANFDRERGDALTITREEAVAFRDAGKEIGAPILWKLVEWFAGNPGDPEPKMEDPRDQRDLSRLIAHQKANVLRCVVKAEKNQESAIVRWGKTPEVQAIEEMPTHTKKCERIPRNANASKYSKDKISSSDKLESLSMSIKNIGPSGVANVAPPGGGTFARTATDTNGDIYSEADFAADPINRVIDFAARCLEHDPSPSFKGNIMKRANQLQTHSGVFIRSCFDVVIDFVKKRHDLADAEKNGRSKEVETILGELCDEYGDNIERTINTHLKRTAAGLGVDTK